MSPFLKRTLTGSVFVLVIIGSILLGRISFLLVFLALSTACLLELYYIMLKARLRPQVLYGLLLGVVIFVINYLYATKLIDAFIFLGIIPLVISLFIVELFRNQNKPLVNIAGTLFGLIYITLPFSLLNYFVLDFSLNRIFYNTEFLLGFFVLIWANDTGAYIFGISFGRHKMFPRVSPKKSWEGLIGGFFTTALVAWVLSLAFYQTHVTHWLAIGFISAVMGVFGDLVESMFKRSIGIKDSGKFLPGHGGLLDRFDAVLLAAPIVYVYLEMMILI